MKKDQDLVKTALYAFIWNHGLFLVSAVILGVTSWVLAKFLGPTGYGVYTGIMAFTSLAILLVSFGYEGALNVYLPRLSEERAKVRYVFRQMFLRRLGLVTALCALVFAVSVGLGYNWIPQLRQIGPFLPLAIACGGVSLLNGLLERVLITEFRVRQLAAVRMSTLTAALLAYLLLLLRGYGIRAVLWVLLATSALALFLVAFACRDLLIGQGNKFPMRHIYSFGRTAWASDLLGYVLGNNMDIVLMMFYGVHASHIAFYQIAFILVRYARTATSHGMAGVVQSAFSSAYNQGGEESLARWWRMVMKFNILVCAPPVLFLVLFARQLFQALLPQYVDAAILLQVYGYITIAGIMLGGGTHATSFYAIGKERIVFWIRLASGILNLLLDLVLIYLWGALGAILATGASGLVMCGIELGVVRHKIQVVYPLIFFLKCCACLGVAGIAAVLVPLSGIVGILASGIVFVTGYIGMARLMRPLETDDVKRFGGVNRRLGVLLSLFSGVKSVPVEEDV